MIPLKGEVRGARSGGMTAHLSGPHLIPNVGREAMLGAEVVRRRPKAKTKPQPQPQTKKHTAEKNASKTTRRRSPERGRSFPRRSRSNSQSRSRARSRTQNDERERSRSPLSGSRQAAGVDDAIWREQQAEAQRREDQRLMEERRQLQLLEEEKRKRKQQEIERNKKLAGFFSLTEDDLEDEQPKAAPLVTAKERVPVQAALSSALELRQSMSSTSSRPVSVREDFEESAGSSGFDKCWGKWDWNKQKDDPGELARQFMKVTAAKRRGYAPSAKGGGSSRPARGRSSSSSRGRDRKRAR